MTVMPSNSMGLDYVFVVVRYADGREEALPFASRFQAELFVSWIPALQMAVEEFAEVRSAIIRPTVQMVEPTVVVERVN